MTGVYTEKDVKNKEIFSIRGVKLKSPSITFDDAANFTPLILYLT